MPKTEFRQSQLAAADGTQGVCRALVLLWLAAKGNVDPAVTFSNSGQIQGLMQHTVADAAMQVPGSLTLVEHAAFEDLVKAVAFVGSQPGLIMIGVGNERAGHAIGFIAAQGLPFQFFDPNGVIIASDDAIAAGQVFMELKRCWVELLLKYEGSVTQIWRFRV
jgi:hypothetical protein